MLIKDLIIILQGLSPNYEVVMNSPLLPDGRVLIALDKHDLYINHEHKFIELDATVSASAEAELEELIIRDGLGDDETLLLSKSHFAACTCSDCGSSTAQKMAQRGMYVVR